MMMMMRMMMGMGMGMRDEICIDMYLSKHKIKQHMVTVPKKGLVIV